MVRRMIPVIATTSAAVAVRQVRYAELFRCDQTVFHSCDFFTVPVTDRDRAIGYDRDRRSLSGNPVKRNGHFAPEAYPA